MAWRPCFVFPSMEAEKQRSKHAPFCVHLPTSTLIPRATPSSQWAISSTEVLIPKRRARAEPVEGLRALVHGHHPVREVETVGNRWNIDTGDG